MSWFTEIAGKAETFLNKIDQNAAVALNTSSTKSERENSRPRKTEPFLEPNEDNRNTSFQSSSTPNDSYTKPTDSFPETKQLNGATSSLSSLNATSTNGGGGTNSVRKNDSKRQQSSSQSNKSSSRNKKSTIQQATENSTSNQSKRENAPPDKVKTNHKIGSLGSTATGSVNNSGSSTSSATTNNAKNNEEDLIAYLNSSSTSDVNESLLMQEEMESQARELKLLNSNHRSLKKNYDEVKKELEIYKDKLTKSESTRESTVAEEEDLRKLLDEKDNEIKDLTNRHEHALEALQKLELSQENLQKLEQCLLENSQLKSENETLLHRTEMLSSQAETAESHVLSMKATLASMEKEFSNYKEKAKSILNYKDELIASLKNEASSSSDVDFNSNTAEELLAEVTALKNDRELLQADLSQTRAVAESLKEDNIRLEKEIDTLRYYSEDLNNQLRREKDVVGNLQNENLQICQQISSLQFELDRERNDKRKSEELVTQFKRSIQSNNQQPTESINSNNTNSSTSQNGCLNSGNSDKEVQKLKTRVNALSQSLFEKQSLINDISTDKQLLQIEVERLQNELRSYRTENNDYCQNSGLPQTVIASQPLYLSESPWDSRVSAKMKRIYTQLDAVFCQFGLALRKRPNLRFGMSLYVIFLHLWVFFVLFSWMHHSTPDPDNL